MSRRRREVSGWFPVPELGFDLLIRYQSPAEMSRMREAALELRRSTKTGEMVEHLNQAIYARELAKVIVGWRTPVPGGEPIPGITREAYARLIPIYEDDYPVIIPCEPEYKEELLLEGRGVVTVTLDLCTTLGRYQNEQVQAELKN